MLNVLVLLAMLLSDDPRANPVEFLAATLDWYDDWLTAGPLAVAQSCSASRSGEYVTVLCVPSRVRIDLYVAANGHCQVTAMRRTENSFDQEVERLRERRRAVAESSPPTDRCLGLVSNSRPEVFKVRVHHRGEDRVLSGKIAELAVQYASRLDPDRRTLQGCKLLTPVVRLGDPLFHVYVQCRGQISQVWEFPRTGGTNISETPHWFYEPGRGGLPLGAGSRSRRIGPWSTIVPLP